MSELDRIPDWMQPDTAQPAHLDLARWAQEFRDVYNIAEALCKTPFVPKEMIGRQADVTAAIMKGRELGLDPFDALGSIYVVHGRVGYYAEFLRRRIIQAGHTLRILETTDNRCVIEGIRREGGDPHRASFTAEQARRAGIDLGKYPADKLIARATSRLCRQAFPDVLSGSLIAEDLIDGLIPADPADPDTAATPPAGSAPTPVQRTRKPKAAKAASTQPKPAPAATEPDPDIAELLGDDNPTPPDLAGSHPTGTDLHDSNEKTAPSDPASQTDDEPAWPKDLLDMPIPDDGPRLITEPQLKKLSILLREAGFDDRDARHDFVASAIGRGITTAKELSRDEASRVIDLLENDQPQREM